MEIFHELALLTLQREDFTTPLLLQNLKSGPVTRDVDLHLSKKISKCLSEIIWVNDQPTAIIAAFFEGQHRIISKEVFKLLKIGVGICKNHYTSTCNNFRAI